jgi:hypothetical protein
MARIRTIKPEFWSSPHMARLDLAERLLFIALWNYADDYGRGPANPKELAGFAFPHDEKVDSEETRRMLGGLSDESLIDLYTVSGRSYYAVVNWERHQKVDKRSQPRHPSPDQADPDPPERSDQREPETLGGFSADSRRTLGAGSRKLEVGSRKLKTSLSKSAAPDSDAAGSPATNGLASQPPPAVSPEAERLTDLFAALVAGNAHVPPKPGTKTRARWLADMDRLLRLGPPGGSAPQPSAEVEAVIRWCAADHGDDRYPGEAVNVASPYKLRRRYSQLLGKTRAAARGNGRDPGYRPGDLTAAAELLRKQGR